ncbi:MAG: rod shape-determining protein MreC [Burkholderiaceae bacterium]|jgi:rod shape-determining protein MreC|nr:rod shape-determining protein MreC [Burkholderiaceae bacterium]
MYSVPPPLFKQGMPALVRVVVFLLFAIVLLMVDSRLKTLTQVRQIIGFALYPAQRAALFPRDLLYMAGDYLSSVEELQDELEQSRKKVLENAQTLQQAQLLATENQHLRELLKLTRQVDVRSISAEILYDARSPYSRKVVLNKGTNDGVVLGQPVIDEGGVVGQVTRVFFSTAEVSLLTDRDQVIPVQSLRSGVRSVVYGSGQPGYLELRFVSANADIKAGDVLVTSGIDGLYPSGLAVGEVTDVVEKAGTFNQILCRPLAGLDKNRHVLVLLADIKIPPPPPEAEKRAAPAKKRIRKGAAPARKKAGTK